MKRKLIATLLLGTLVFTLSGCGNKNNKNINTGDNVEVSTNETSGEIDDSSKEDKNDAIDENKKEDNDTETIVEDTQSTDEKSNNSEGDKTESSLKSGKILYYEGFTGKSYYLTKELSLDDESKVIEIVEALKELPPTDYLEDVRYQEFTPFPSDITVNSVEVKDDLVLIDFNKNFAESLGSAGEKSITESLVNSIGYNLNKNKVIITFNGDNYSSGHIVMSDGEYFEVSNTEGIKLSKN